MLYSGSATLTTGGLNTTEDSFGGVISGTGGLIKIGTGTMTLTGTNTYSGGTLVSAGMLQGNALSLQGQITNNAAVVFNQTNIGTLFRRYVGKRNTDIDWHFRH